MLCRGEGEDGTGQKQFAGEIYAHRGIGMGPCGKGLALQNESSARAVAMALQY